MTISSFASADSAQRNSLTDVFGQIDEQNFRKAATIIGDALLSTIYQSNVSFITIEFLFTIFFNFLGCYQRFVSKF